MTCWWARYVFDWDIEGWVTPTGSRHGTPDTHDPSNVLDRRPNPRLCVHPKPPFTSNNRKMTIERILGTKVRLPAFLTSDAKDLLRKVGGARPVNVTCRMHLVNAVGGVRGAGCGVD